MRELEVSDETLALDLIDQIGPDGHFMGAQHTRKHFREDWYPQLFEQRNYDGWLKAGGKTLRERAQEKALSILEHHQPEPLAPEVQDELDSIVARSNTSLASLSV